MPSNNQGNRRDATRSRSKNNNPEGHNQYSGWTDTARERPFATAAAAAAAVGASVFLWSRRSQISEQLSNLSDQIGEWSETMNASGSPKEFETAGGERSFSGSPTTSSGSQFIGSGPAGSPTGDSSFNSATGTSARPRTGSSKAGNNKSGRPIG